MQNHSILVALTEVLEQERSLLSQLDPAVYTAPGTGAFRSSIGAHIRHNLDHFTSFFAGLPDARIDYEKRRRDDGIARSPEHALADIDQHIAALAGLMQDAPGSFLQVREESESAAQDELRWLDSSVGRELQFLLGHTVHHHAIIALLLAQQGIDLPADFGVAPSTQRHERHQAGGRSEASG
jgi:hypothetical protein